MERPCSSTIPSVSPSSNSRMESRTEAFWVLNAFKTLIIADCFYCNVFFRAKVGRMLRLSFGSAACFNKCFVALFGSTMSLRATQENARLGIVAVLGTFLSINRDSPLTSTPRALNRAFRFVPFLGSFENTSESFTESSSLSSASPKIIVEFSMFGFTTSSEVTVFSCFTACLRCKKSSKIYA